MASSLRKYQQDPGQILSTAKMMSKGGTGRITIVAEGESDYRFLTQWISDGARLTNAQGKRDVKLIWKKSCDARFTHLVCVADLDFEPFLTAEQIRDPRFIYVSADVERVDTRECIDLESFLIRSNALYKFLVQKLPAETVYKDLSSAVSSIREKARIAAASIGSFRLADQMLYQERRISPIGNLEIRDGVDWFDSRNLEVNRETLESILHKSSRVGGDAMEIVCKRANELFAKHGDGWELCRGHDASMIISLHLSTLLPRRVDIRELETGLRMACEIGMIRDTSLGRRIDAASKALSRELLRV